MGEILSPIPLEIVKDNAYEFHCSAGQMKTITTVAIALGSIVSLILIGALHRSESSRVSDPSGKYTAICTYRTYLSYLAMSPGSSNDKPCFVGIVGSKGEDYGEVPVEMIQLAGIEWRTDGAEIAGVGEWDFAHRTCWYWSDDHNHQIYVKR